MWQKLLGSARSGNTALSYRNCVITLNVCMYVLQEVDEIFSYNNKLLNYKIKLILILKKETTKFEDIKKQ